MKLNETILEVVRELRNTFEDEKATGNFTIEDGLIRLPNTFKNGMWIAITGSNFSDGIYMLAQNSEIAPFKLTNGSDEVLPVEQGESFNGAIYHLKLPPGFVKLAGDIMSWANDPINTPSAVTSESVVGFHSWSKATRQSGLPLGWQQVFSSKLSAFNRRMFSTIQI